MLFASLGVVLWWYIFLHKFVQSPTDHVTMLIISRNCPSLHMMLPMMSSHGLLRIPVHNHLHLQFKLMDDLPLTSITAGPSLHLTLPTMLSHGLLRIPVQLPSSAVDGPPSRHYRSQSPSDATHNVKSQSTKDTSKDQHLET